MVTVAQSAELWIVAPAVVGSSPIGHPFYCLKKQLLQHTLINRLNWQFQIELIESNNLSLGKAFLLPTIRFAVDLYILLILAHEHVDFECRAAHVTSEFLDPVVAFGTRRKYFDDDKR